MSKNRVKKETDRHHEHNNYRIHLRRGSWMWVPSTSTTGARASQGSGKNHDFNTLTINCVKTTLMHNKVSVENYSFTSYDF